jgi:tetratricopeptide (TPR) repeat protein
MNMRSIIVVVIVFVSFSSFAQKKKKGEEAKPITTQPAIQEAKKTEPAKKDSVPPQVDILTQHFARKYSTAVQWNDYDVAKDALYDLIVRNPGNDSLIFDLAVFYYQNEKPASAVLVSKELLTRNPKNVGALEISAAGYETLGVLDKSLQNYESLYFLTNNMGIMYKMAFLQYRLKRYKESSASADILLTSKDIDTSKVNFNGTDGKPKEFSMKVAVINLKGMIALDQGDKITAKKMFDQALVIAPDFAPAKEGLAKTK